MFWVLYYSKSRPKSRDEDAVMPLILLGMVFVFGLALYAIVSHFIGDDSENAKSEDQDYDVDDSHKIFILSEDIEEEKRKWKQNDRHWNKIKTV